VETEVEKTRMVETERRRKEIRREKAEEEGRKEKKERTKKKVVEKWEIWDQKEVKRLVSERFHK